MKRLIALAATVVCAVVMFSAPAMADIANGSMQVKPLRWFTSLAAVVGGGADSTGFTADGSSAANRDTSDWVYVGDMVPWSPGIASAGDSTQAIGISIQPVQSPVQFYGTTFGIGADSLYAYVEGTSSPDGGPTVRLATNLTEILSLETNSNNTFDFRITWARWALQLGGLPYVRVIVRGDLNGAWRGNLRYTRSAISLEGDR